MSKKYNNPNPSLNLDAKTSEAIKILMEEGLYMAQKYCA